jgi:hypothetical protein
LILTIVGIGIPDGRFVIQGVVGVGMLKMADFRPLSHSVGEGSRALTCLEC